MKKDQKIKKTNNIPMVTELLGSKARCQTQVCVAHKPIFFFFCIPIDYVTYICAYIKEVYSFLLYYSNLSFITTVFFI